MKSLLCSSPMMVQCRPRAIPAHDIDVMDAAETGAAGAPAPYQQRTQPATSSSGPRRQTQMAMRSNPHLATYQRRAWTRRRNRNSSVPGASSCRCSCRPRKGSRMPARSRHQRRSEPLGACHSAAHLLMCWQQVQEALGTAAFLQDVLRASECCFCVIMCVFPKVSKFLKRTPPSSSRLLCGESGSVFTGSP